MWHDAISCTKISELTPHNSWPKIPKSFGRVEILSLLSSFIRRHLTRERQRQLLRPRGGQKHPRQHKHNCRLLRKCVFKNFHTRYLNCYWNDNTNTIAISFTNVFLLLFHTRYLNNEPWKWKDNTCKQNCHLPHKWGRSRTKFFFPIRYLNMQRIYSYILIFTLFDLPRNNHEQWRRTSKSQNQL